MRLIGYAAGMLAVLGLWAVFAVRAVDLCFLWHLDFYSRGRNQRNAKPT